MARTRKPPIHPVRWQPPPVEPLPEQSARPVTVVPVPGHGPEDVVVDAHGNLWTGLVDGRIVRIAPGGEQTVVTNTGGRPLGMHVARDGLKALNLLKGWADTGEVMTDKLLMVFTDAEMPEMDGYRLTTEIRNDPRLRGLYVVMHTSLSGSFNDAMVKKVGCDNFLSKFQPDRLVDVVQERLMLDQAPG